MGSNGSRILEIDNLDDRLSECQQLAVVQCPIYGQVNYVNFKGMEFFLGQSMSQSLPHKMSLHYLVKPNLLLYPNYTLLEDIKVNGSLLQILSVIKGIAQTALEGGHIGIGYGRVAYNARWGVVGQKDIFWPYNQIFYEGNPQGVYLSPQLVMALSQGIQNPRVDYEKADIFALGVMIVEILFETKLDQIYDYEGFQFYLNPLLEKVLIIKEQFGQHFYKVLIAMLQIEENDRIDFESLLQHVDILISQNARQMANSNNSNHGQRSMEYSRGHNRTPSKKTSGIYAQQQVQKSPKSQQGGTYRNDISPFRGRFGSNVRPSRGDRQSKSPLKRDMKINTRFQKENPMNYNSNRPAFTQQRNNLSPMMRR